MVYNALFTSWFALASGTLLGLKISNLLGAKTAYGNYVITGVSFTQEWNLDLIIIITNLFKTLKEERIKLKGEILIICNNFYDTKKRSNLTKRKLF